MKTSKRSPGSSGASPLRRTWLMPVALVLVTATSCNYGPARVDQPAINPAQAGRAAVEQYDANGDGVVSGEELAKAAGLQAALPRLDSDGDNAISAEEVAARIEAWQEMKTGLMSFSFTVLLNGRPLEGAIVTFEPEEFLGDDIQPATGVTDFLGGGKASIPKELRPDPESTPPGMQLGLYRVKISKVVGGKETIPEAYNVHTTLGQEVAPDVPEIANHRVIYTLTSR